MNDNTLAIKWSKREHDLMIYYPRSCDGHLIQSYICANIHEFDFLKWIDEQHKNRPNACYRTFNLKDELIRRGYDITTLKFSIELKKP
jgi:hypothetical protein